MNLLRSSWLAGCSLLLAAGLLGACQSGSESADSAQQTETEPAAPAVERAVAVIHPTEGNEVSGTVLFSRENEGIRIQARLQGLSEGAHGFHVHQYGDCTASDGTSAGGHFNPFDMPHAGPTDAKRHVGDLGNISADAEGVGTYNRVDTVVAFSGQANVLGRAMVVHGGEDDMSSQPSGAAGPRVACGVIGVANPQTSVSTSG